VQPERLERIVEEGGQGFGAVALALLFRCDREAHLGLTRLVGVHLERQVSDEVAVRPRLQRELEPLAGHARRGSPQRLDEGFTTLECVVAPALVPRDVGVRAVGDECLDVGG